MTTLFYITVGVCLIVFQTIIAPASQIFDGFYDLIVPFIVYFSLFRPVRQAFLAVFVMGFIMDNLSGGPFGLYLTTYFWFFICIRWMVGYLRVSNTVLLPLVVVGSVLVENIIFLGTIAVLTPGAGFPKGAFDRVSEQVVWAFFTGALLLMLLDYCQKQIEIWKLERLAKKETEDDWALKGENKASGNN